MKGSNPSKFLMLSGGIDSAYVLYDHLRSTDEPLYVHHVNLINKEGRLRYEKEATEKVLAYMDNKFGSDRITYSESTFSYGSMPKIVRDHNVWSFHAGILMATVPSLESVLLPQHSDSYTKGDIPGQFEMTRRKYVNMARVIAHKDLEVLYPIKQITKAEVIVRTPNDLLKLAWFCRRPKADGDVCGKCLTCRQVYNGLKIKQELNSEVEEAINATKRSR